MNANAIFNAVANDSYGSMKAYNDTVDPRRKHTLCGRLDETEKKRLQHLIRSCPHATNEYREMLLDIIDGDTTLLPHVDRRGRDVHRAYTITSCYHVPNVSRVPWIHHNNPRFMRDIIGSYTPTTKSIREKADYIVALDNIERDDYDGKLIFPAVAEIILAEITLRKTTATVGWLRVDDNDHPSGLIHLRYIERVMLGEQDAGCYYTNDSLVKDLATGYPKHNHTVRDVYNYFSNVNRLISTPDLWRIFEHVLLRGVNDSAVKIVTAIRATRMHKVWLTLFWSNPKYESDIRIVTVV